MNNVKTGALIKELRKEKNMTQRELAGLLHITDRAVSKWERGLCAPDISILEPLAKILEVSILDLIEGEKTSKTEHIQELEESAKTVIDYSKIELAHKLKTSSKKHLGIIATCITLILILVGLCLWQYGYFYIIDSCTSPDNNNQVTVYSKGFTNFFSKGFSMKDATSIVMTHKDDKNLSTRISYEDCVYQGIWWAPDSKKYVIALEYDDSVNLSLAWLERNSSSNLSAYLSMGVEMTELSKYGYLNKDIFFPRIEYQFLQWALDSKSMLIYYSFEDNENKIHDGYFWYNCELGTVSAILEMDS